MKYYKEKQEAVELFIMTKCNGLDKCEQNIEHALLGIPKSEQNHDTFLFMQIACE